LKEIQASQQKNQRPSFMLARDLKSTLCAEIEGDSGKPNLTMKIAVKRFFEILSYFY
jgi:hypothetical protein